MWITSPRATDSSYSPRMDDDLPDTDPDVVAGMQRLAELRAVEGEVVDLKQV